MDVAFLLSALREDQYPPGDGPEIAFAGRSNVGKSSLINTLLNRRKLARTSSTPGRTQALNFFKLGNRLYLVDLPGYGFARVPPAVKASWGRLVENYLRRRDNLSAVVVILDIRREPAEGDLELLRWLRHYRIPALCVLTKVDKLSRGQAANRRQRIARLLGPLCEEDLTLFSAKTGQGRDRLWERIRAVTGERPQGPAGKGVTGS